MTIQNYTDNRLRTNIIDEMHNLNKIKCHFLTKNKNKQ